MGGRCGRKVWEESVEGGGGGGGGGRCRGKMIWGVRRKMWVVGRRIDVII